MPAIYHQILTFVFSKFRNTKVQIDEKSYFMHGDIVADARWIRTR